jgi:hypothetical protein
MAAMTPPVELVFKSDDVIDEIASEPVVVEFVVLAFVEKRLGNVLIPDDDVAVKYSPTT